MGVPKLAAAVAMLHVSRETLSFLQAPPRYGNAEFLG
jgi:hypothetical protein